MTPDTVLMTSLRTVSSITMATAVTCLAVIGIGKLLQKTYLRNCKRINEWPTTRTLYSIITSEQISRNYLLFPTADSPHGYSLTHSERLSFIHSLMHSLIHSFSLPRRLKQKVITLNSGFSVDCQRTALTSDVIQTASSTSITSHDVLRHRPSHYERGVASALTSSTALSTSGISRKLAAAEMSDWYGRESEMTAGRPYPSLPVLLKSTELSNIHYSCVGTSLVRCFLRTVLFRDGPF